MRRLALASIIGIVSGNAAAAPVIGLLITVAFSFVFAYLQPLKKSDTLLGTVLSFSLVLLFIAALMIKVDATSDDEDDQEIFGVLLIVVLFTGPVSFVFESRMCIYVTGYFKFGMRCFLHRSFPFSASSRCIATSRPKKKRSGKKSTKNLTVREKYFSAR